MKEFSVDFYKKLIIFVMALLLVSAVAFAGFSIKHYLDGKDGRLLQNQEKTGNSSEKPTEQKDGSSQEHISSGDDLQKIKERIEQQRKEKQDKNIGMQNSDFYAYDEPEKVIYLTFDDGASKTTEEILDILKENNIKATFFFNASEQVSSDEIIRKAYENGNTIGVSTSLKAPLLRVYESAEDFGRDIDQSTLRFQQITGEKPTVLRFPGGSLNSLTEGRISEFTAQVKSRGLVYFDWNLCAEGKGNEKGLDVMVANSTKIKRGVNRYILLMHDNGNKNTPQALRRIIDFYKAEGFEFLPLNEGVKPIVF